MPFARDIYEEGGLIFPAVRVQRDYEDIADVIRMCRAGSGCPTSGTATTWRWSAPRASARPGSRSWCQVRGGDDQQFVEEWFDYSERRVAHVISQMPEATITGHGRHDPFGPLPEGIPINVKVSIDPEPG